MGGGVLIPEDDNGHKGPGRWVGVYTNDTEPRAIYEGHDPNTAVDLSEWWLQRYGEFPRIEVAW